MKKLAVGVGLFVAMVGFCFLNSRPALADGNQGVNWSTPWGGSWMTPGTCGANNNVLQVSGSNCTVVASTNVTVAGTLTATSGTVTVSSAAVGLIPQSLTQVQTSTPSFVGQLVFCQNCVNSLLCISSTTASPGAGNDWVSVSTGTGTGSAQTACK